MKLLYSFTTSIKIFVPFPKFLNLINRSSIESWLGKHVLKRHIYISKLKCEVY